ncbi:hypothetical protein AGLY_006026 [Aphis glycines]|uniref:Uncharacterized protein n=1 Tax=Aphis glycines TaxID=307491 RepID=A0A6G0TSQ7_APHGL|nr:hypothetical protein AGLY_006026 [Aphis glycines]
MLVVFSFDSKFKIKKNLDRHNSNKKKMSEYDPIQQFVNIINNYVKYVILLVTTYYQSIILDSKTGRFKIREREVIYDLSTMKRNSKDNKTAELSLNFPSCKKQQLMIYVPGKRPRHISLDIYFTVGILFWIVREELDRVNDPSIFLQTWNDFGYSRDNINSKLYYIIGKYFSHTYLKMDLSRIKSERCVKISFIRRRELTRTTVYELVGTVKFENHDHGVAGNSHTGNTDTIIILSFDLTRRIHTQK